LRIVDSKRGQQKKNTAKTISGILRKTVIPIKFSFIKHSAFMMKNARAYAPV